MKKFPIVLAAVALVAAGCFAAASIASGGSFARMLTGTDATVTTATTTTPTDTNEHGGGQPSGRRVALCHKTGPKKSPKFHTITVDQHAVKAHLKHGDTLGACPPKAPATTTPATTTTSSDDHGKGNSGDHGKSGDHGNNGKGHGKP